MENINQLLESIDSDLQELLSMLPEDCQMGYQRELYTNYVVQVQHSVIEHHNYFLSKVQELKDIIINKDMIVLSEDEHEVMKYFDRHLLCDRVEEK